MADGALTAERLAELERLAKGCLSWNDWMRSRGTDREDVALTWTPEAKGEPAALWYSDGDQAAVIHGNLGLGFCANAWAAFFAAADPGTVLALVARVRELEAALRPFADLWVDNATCPDRVVVRVWDYKEATVPDPLPPTMGDCRKAAELLGVPPTS